MVADFKLDHVLALGLQGSSFGEYGESRFCVQILGEVGKSWGHDWFRLCIRWFWRVRRNRGKCQSGDHFFEIASASGLMI